MNLLTFSSYLLFCIFALSNVQRTAIRPNPAIATNPMGVNLATYNDYSPEFLFNDVFKSSRPWTAVDSMNGQSNQGINIPLRASDGYPAQLPQGSYVARTYVLMDLPHGYPSGQYRFRSSGRGRIRLSLRSVAGSRVVLNSPVNTTFQTDGINGVIIEILSSDPNDPVHNIQLRMPRTSTTFNRHLLTFLRGFDCIRWMDLMRTNSSPISVWSQRTSTSYYSQAQTTGVAYEYLIQLNNRVRKDAWVNIPHAADNNFIAQFAALLRDQLNPSLKIYVEYSNEVWNPGDDFRQHLYAQQQGQHLGYPGNAADQARRFYAKRSADVFAIFDSVFQSQRTRLVKVLASQAGYFEGSQMVVAAFNDPFYNPRGVRADALAIAPYFGGQVGQGICIAGTAATISVNEVLDLLEQDLAAVDARIQAYKSLVDANQLSLFAYECGQHLANGTCLANADLTQKLTAANRHPRMEELYCRYIESWFNRQGGLFMHYNSHSTYNQHGSWGLKEYIGQPDASAHKYRAWMRVKARESCE